jgi:hypothetical protein
MSVQVQKYIKNLGKSITYSAADVLNSKFEYINETKQENQEVFKEVYHSIKDYKNTFARVKKTITDNKVMDAARVGYNSVLYSITTGDFYAKQREAEVMEKYGGSFMQGFDMDDDDFDWDNDDLSTGDKVVATAIKKNSKIGTALTVEAISQTGKAQMDVSRENTMLLYTQNERMLNKLDNGFGNILGFLKQNGEQTAKVQNQMNENLNKFMTNVDNNITKLTKQMDELLEMQRNMYNPKKEEEKRKVGYDDMISRNGVLNIKEYSKHVKKNAFNTINDMSGGMLSYIFGDSLGQGSNLLAQFSANPFRTISETFINKALGKNFDRAAKELNTTLEGIVPSLIGKLNAASKKDDSGIMGFLGKIFGIKDGSRENIDTSRYNKGAIPFDGITKRAITDVIPYYLRKMTSVLTGEQEMIYDFQTGKWSSMKAVKAAHDNAVNSAKYSTANALTGIIESGLGGRRLSDSYKNKYDYDKIVKAIESLAGKLQNAGDFGSVDESLDIYERDVMKMLREAMRLDDGSGNDRRFTRNSKGKRISSGIQRSAIGGFNNMLRQNRLSQNNTIKSINNGDSILRIIESEGLASQSTENYQAKSFVNSHGDFDQNKIQQMPVTQALIRGRDEYGVTLYQYLRDMDLSLRYIKANSTYLGSLNSNENGESNKNNEEIVKHILKDGDIDFTKDKESQYIEKYFENMQNKNRRKEEDDWDKRISEARKRAAAKGEIYTLATSTDFESSNGDTGIANIMRNSSSKTAAKAKIAYTREQQKQEEERWKAIAGIIGQEEANKARANLDQYDSDKSIKDNMEKVKDKGFTASLMMFAKSLGNKIRNPGDAAADTIVKVDYWLQKLIYGEDLKDSENGRKSLFENMKDQFQKGIQGIRESIDKGFEKLKEKVSPLFKPLKELGKKIFGTKDENGFYQGGMIGSFIGGVQKGFRRNSSDFSGYIKNQYSDFKNRFTQDRPEPELSSKQKYDARRSEIMNKLNREAESENQIISGNALEKIANISAYRVKQSSVNNEKIDGDVKRAARKQAMIDELTRKIENQEASVISSEKSIASLKQQLQTKLYNNEDPGDLEKKLESQEKVLEKTKANLKNNKQKLAKIVNSTTKNKYMAVGGVNKTGKPFRSVLSAGELHNGNIVPKMGIYQINPGDTVINPAGAATRAKQANAERKYLANIRRNAEANDKLTPTDDTKTKDKDSDEQNKKKIQQLLTDTDWNSLSTKEQKKEYIGNVVSKGLIGGGLGLLVGGPLIGASIGAASALTKSTGSFASFLFGEAVTDKDGNIQVDDKGNVKRADNGLISQEIMKAVPDIKKYGLGGAIAGLLTPIGPLGGVLVGSALGFAKNSEIFQGSLFGEGGIFSEENKAKFKKGAKSMGIGAAIGAFTGGPFGLVGNALLGATAGYVTSTDKFKDFVLGEKDDPNNPESKRHGGVMGVLKSAVEPLKDFGKTLTNGILDAVFGKKNGENGKREGGLFGLVRKTIIDPLADGTKTMVNALNEKVRDIGFMAKKTWKKIQRKMAGNDGAGVFGEFGQKIAKGATKIAKGAIMAPLLPLMGGVKLAQKGIFNPIKRKSIRTGKASHMTARERLKARGELGMAEYDDYTLFDNSLTEMDNDSIQSLKDRLSVYVDGDDAAFKEQNNLFDSTGRELRDYISSKNANKIMKSLKKNDYREAERLIRTGNFKIEGGEANRGKLEAIIKKHKRKYSTIDERMAKANSASKLSSKVLKDEYGLDVDLNDPRDVDKVKRMLDRELIHNEAGLTEEDMEFDRMREFWSDDKSPLKTVNSGVEAVVKTLDNIYNEVKLGNEYDKLSDEEKSKYESREDYIQKNKATAEPDATQDKLNGKKSDSTNKHRKFSRVKMVQENPDKFSKTIKRIIEEALKLFDGKVMEEISDPNKIKIDIDKWKLENPDKDYNNEKLIRTNIIIDSLDQKYEFDCAYVCKQSGNNFSVEIAKNQSESFETCREDFANAYLDARMPKSAKGKGSYMSFKDMVKKTIKISGFFVAASIVPGGALVLGAKLAFMKIAKKRGWDKKLKNGIRRVKNDVKHVLGSHAIDSSSKRQQRKEKNYNAKAEKVLQKMIEKGDAQLDTIAQEKYKKNYSELTDDEKSAVNATFKERYVNNKIANQVTGHGLLGNIKAAPKALMGTLKSGIKNLTAGKIDKVKEKIQKQKEEDRFIGKLFNKLDKWKLGRDEKNFKGKKDSRLAKILKWLFIGGIAVPILVGFVKDKIMPAVHDKIQPWLKKAAQKLIGTKNEQTGEYEGGIIAGIVNPVRNFFKDKFQTISDWFHNKGKFTSPDTGFKGLIGNFKSAINYGITLWKDGTSTILNDCLPKVVEGIVANLPTILGAIGTGLINGIKDIFFGKKDGTGEQSLETVNASQMVDSTSSSSDNDSSSSSTGIKFNNTVGGTWVETVGGSSTKVGSYVDVVSLNSDIYQPTSRKTNDDGSTTLTNENTGESVTSEFIDDDSMVSAGTNKAGDKIYYKRTDVNRTQPYTKANDGEYVRMDKQSSVMLSSLQDNQSYADMVADNDAGDAGVTDSYTGTNPALEKTAYAGKVLTKAATSKSGAKGLSMAIKAGGKGVKIAGKMINLIPGTNVAGWATKKSLGKVGDKIVDSADDVSYKYYNFMQSKISKAVENSKVLSKVNNAGIKIKNAPKNIAEKAKNAIKNKMGKTAENATKNAAENAAEKAAKETAEKTAKEAAENVTKNAAESVMESSTKNAAKTGGTSFLAKSVKELFEKAKSKIIEWFAKLFKGSAVKEAAKNAGREITEETAEKLAKETGEKLVKECAEQGAEKIATVAGKNLVSSACDCSGIGVVINIAFAIADFLLGMDDARNILQITGDDIPLSYRFFAGLANTMQDIPIVGILLGCIGAKNIVYYLVEWFGDILFPEATEELKKRQEEAQQTLEQYNAQNNTNLTLEQYNNKKYATVSSTVSGWFSDAGSFLSGKDATVSEAMETRRNVADSNDTVTDIREKLESIASHMWEKQGDKFKDFNLSKDTYGKLCAEVIDKIVLLLNGLDDDSLSKVLTSAGKIETGFWANAGYTTLKYLTFGAYDGDPFVDAWDDGYKGLSYLGLDKKDGWENTSVVKCIGGIASVFVKACGGANLKWKIIDIVISVFGNGMAGDSIDENSKKLVENSNSKISNINDAYDSNLHGNSGTTSVSLSSSDSSSTSTAEDVVANANANSKLSAISGLYNTAKSNMINTAGFIDDKISSSLFGEVYNNAKSTASGLYNTAKSNLKSTASGLYNTAKSNMINTAGFIDDKLSNSPFGGIYNYDKSAASGLWNFFKGIFTNAEANSNLSPINMTSNNKDKNSGSSIGRFLMLIPNTINNAITNMTGDLSKIEDMFSGLVKKNKSINDSIDSLSLLPTDKKYWDIEVDNDNPFVSGLFKFVESMNRVVKAPFSLAVSSLGKGLSAVSSSSSNSSSSSSSSSSSGSTNSSDSSSSSSSSSSGGILSKIATGAKSIFKKVSSGIKSFFGFGKGKDDYDDTGYGDDPFHIYQRDYKGSYRTTGDSESQTIADSGCGPAAAASLLRMYGKKGDMHNAVNYALSNKYKEVDGGTYPQYFNDYLNKNGISTNSNADNNDVVNSLIHNKPVILMGRDSSNSGTTPYGSKYSHYVVARGLDSNGNVIVEDSEDKNGSTRYSLADTLRNSSVRITTGNGKYGRGATSSMAENFTTGVSYTVTSAVSNIVSNAANSVAGLLGSSSTSSSTSNDASASTNGVEGSITADTDVKTKCGYTADQLKAAITSIHSGCSAEQFPELAIQVENSKGVNALFTIAVAISEHGWDGTIGVNTTGANWGNYNPFNISGSPNSSNGRWKDYNSLSDAFNGFGDLIMGSGYYQAGLTTPGTIGPRYCDSGWASGVCTVADMIVKKISGSGKGKEIMSTFNNKFLSNVNNAVNYFATKSLASLSSGSTSSSDSQSNNANNSSGGTANVDIDAETTIICGDSVTHGLSSTSLGDRAMGLSSGTTDKNNTTTYGSYESIFKAKSDIIANATDAIFFWGMNEVNTSMSTDDYFARYQDSIDTILGYGGRSTSNTNIYILPVIWVPDNSGYGGSFNASKVEKFNSTYIKPFAQKKGYTFVDIYEDSKNVPHEAGNVHPSNYQKLYEIIKGHMAGNSNVDVSDSGSGRGSGRKGSLEAEQIISANGRGRSRKIGTGRGQTKNHDFVGGSSSGEDLITLISKKRRRKKYGRGIWGRDGEETTDTTTTTDTEATDDTESTDETTDDTSSSSSSSSSGATGLISLLSQYSSAVTRGIFGNFYDAIYGDTSEQSVSSNTGNSSGGSLTEGDAEANMKSMFNYFKGEGFSDNLAAGILGNVKGESGFDPHVVEGGSSGTITTDMSHGYGLIQWTGASGRACLYNWCTANNCDPETLDGQTKWIVAQIKGTNISDEANSANASMFNGQTGQGTMSYNWSLFQKKGSFSTFNGYTLHDAVKLWLECAERPADMDGALTTRVKYAEEILAACTSGSGRGKAKDLITKKARPKRSKYGKGIWGRDGEETTASDTSTATDTSTTDTSTDTTTDETTTDDTSSSSSSSSSNSGAKSLISKLSSYAKATIKGVYGNFYDALYGSEAVEDTSSGTTGDRSDIIYAAAMVFEALYNADPSLYYDSSGSTHHDLVCRDGTKLEHERPDCSGMMSAVIHYMGYYTARYSTETAYTDTYHGEGFGTQNWDSASGNTCIYDADGNLSNDWEVLSSDVTPQPGDIRFAADHGHTDMFVFYDGTNYPRGFNAGSGDSGSSTGNGMYNSYCLATYYFNNNNQLPDPSTVSSGRGQNGAGTIQDNNTKLVLRYKGSGNGRFGRGSSRSKKPDFNKLNNIPIDNKRYTDDGSISSYVSKQIVQNQISGTYRNGKGGYGRGILKSLDDVQQKTANSTLFSGTKNNSTLSSTSSTSTGSSYSSNSSSNSSYLGTNGNATVDLNQLIGLISVIANNADKMDAVLQLLGSIAVNTENTTNAISTNKNSNNSTSKNGLSALRTALDSNSSGVDIANAVYQIAKS